jgi:hypothetical protein
MRQPARTLSALLLTVLCTFTTFTALASGPTFWISATAADFLKGTSDGVVVSLEGVLSLGPALTSRLTSAPAQIWSVAESTDGTLWAGTGGDGRVIRIRPGAPEETVFDAEETNVFALAVSGTRVYAATSPDGRVYVIDGAAPARPFFDPEEKYIWALSVDSSGRVWVGAGSPGAIYRVDANGTGRAIYRPSAAHVVALARDAQGRMLAGTESPGRLYRIGADDRPFALLDTGLTEVRAIATQPDGTIVAAAMTRGDEPAAAGADAAVVASVATAATPPPAAAPAAASATPPTRKSVLFRVDPAGLWEPIWETTDLIYDLTPTSEGHVLIATGPEGRLYRLEGGREALLLTGVDARQITRFAGPARAGMPVAAFATANPGRVMVPVSGVAAPPTATFTSTVRDSRSLATWGQIRWEGAGAVTLQTRSGNTERPDDSWSDWSPVYTRREGEAIQSPAARFLQWRATFTRPATTTAPSTAAGATITPARLTSVTIAYLPRNVRPVVSSVTVHPPGVVFQRSFSSEEGAIAGLDDVTAEARRPPGDAPQPSTPGRRMFQRGLQTFAWKAEDADGDRLTYTVEFRREGDATWRTLRTGLLDPLVVWDTTSAVDGRYVIRVRASDHAANAADRALVGDRESDAFAIDNTPPVVTMEVTRSAAGVRVVATARDAQSPIQKLEYALAGGGWQLVYPADGLADAPEERFEFTLPADADVSRLIIRATDLLQNVGTAAGR